MYFCENCNSIFTHPVVITNGTEEREVGRVYTEYCPICSEEGMVEPAGVCPKCGDDMPPHEILCTNCQNTLKFKFRNFIDFLTAEEEELLDDMLDGRSVTEI